MSLQRSIHCMCKRAEIMVLHPPYPHHTQLAGLLHLQNLELIQSSLWQLGGGVKRARRSMSLTVSDCNRHIAGHIYTDRAA